MPTDLDANPITFDIHALDRAPLARIPFDHLIVPKFIDAASVARLAGSWPDLENPGPCELPDQLPPALLALVERLSGRAFRYAVASKFGIDLAYCPTDFEICDRYDGPGEVRAGTSSTLVTVIVYPNIATGKPDEAMGLLRMLYGQYSMDKFAAEVPAVGGALVAFRCSPVSWHGRTDFRGSRKYLQMSWREG